MPILGQENEWVVKYHLFYRLGLHLLNIHKREESCSKHILMREGDLLL